VGVLRPDGVMPVSNLCPNLGNQFSEERIETFRVQGRIFEWLSSMYIADVDVEWICDGVGWHRQGNAEKIVIKDADGVPSLVHLPWPRFPLFANRSQVFLDIPAVAFLERLALEELGKTFTPADIPGREFFMNSSRQNDVTVGVSKIFDSLRHLRNNIKDLKWI